MAAEIITIAGAIVSEFALEWWTNGGTVQRAYVPVFALEDMATLHITVVPRSLQRVSVSRSHDQVDYVIDVGVMKRVDPTNANLDALMDIVQTIADRLKRVKLTNATSWTCVEVVNAPVFSPEHIEELGQFSSILTFTYRGAR